jgi:hypothetical protein
MITFTYEVDERQKYVFRYFPDRSSASVSYPNGNLTSEAVDISTVDVFGDWVESVIGGILPPNTLSLFKYIFDKLTNNGNLEFRIQAAYLVSICMTDSERDSFKAEAVRLDNEKFAKSGFRFNLNQVQVIYTARHRTEAHVLLHQFNEDLRLS